MAKETIVGINCSHGRLSLAFMKNGAIKKTVVADVPENVMQHGEILSDNLYAALIRGTMKENGINAKKAAYVFSSANIFVRNLTLPKMDEDKIKLSIPFEFRDFIQGELKDFIFDYAWRPPLPGEEDDGMNVNLMAVAIPRSIVEQIAEILKSAGLKLVKAVPDICVFENLLLAQKAQEDQLKERCFLDIGGSTSRMIIFKNGRYKLNHMIDIGERRIVQMIADEMNVDMHIAKTYLAENYNDCQAFPTCVSAYKDISLEVLKGLNFYEISDMSARLNDVVICGGGAMTDPLVELLKERITMNVITMKEFLNDKKDDINITAEAVGILMR